MATDFACPVCGEPATFRPPINWMPEWGPRPAFSHLDGDQPCFLVGERRNEPARPVAKSLLASPGADLALERDRDEVHERIADEPIGYEACPPLEDW